MKPLQKYGEFCRDELGWELRVLDEQRERICRQLPVAGVALYVGVVTDSWEKRL